jgi:hypothetical protein
MFGPMIRKRLVFTTALTCLAAVGLVAGDLAGSLVQTEGRRQVAEAGLRDIKKKSAEAAEQVRERYREAESSHNAWLAAVSQAIQQNAANPPEVSAAVEAASSALVEWVKVRNRALGEAEPNDAAIAAVKRMVARDLTEIAAASWRANRRTDDGRRAKAVTSLGDRLQWKKWEDVQ